MKNITATITMSYDIRRNKKKSRKIPRLNNKTTEKNLRGTFPGFFFLLLFLLASSVTLYNQFLFVGNVVLLYRT